MSKPIYESSTQFKHWRFSKQSLSKTRHHLNQTAVQAIQSTLDAEEPGSSKNVQFINAEEELLLIRQYLTKIPKLCTMFHFPEEVEATADSYLKRFYLRNTVMDWHPRNVMLTALFLAAKVTNNPISIEAYASRIPNTTQADILELEFLVAQSIRFDFAIHHVHRALYGLWLDLQTLPDEPIPSQELYREGLTWVRTSRLTDVELIYTPSQIALACLALCNSALAHSWIASKYPDDDSGAASLISVIEDIGNIIRVHGKEPELEVAREIDRRLRICTNPERIPGTKAFLRKQQAEEQKEQEKRARKAQDVKKERDPFKDDTDEDGQQPAMEVDDEDDD